MNTWVLLLLLLCCSGGGNASQNDSVGNTGNCGRDGERRGRDRDCGCDRNNDYGNGCDGNESRFEPRFEARPFGSGETCGCEEKND
ncbi:MAG: hypothetical protein NC341_03100 [Blautia sp.]|nr:hypothetical protein [Blautia sp.]MCM1200606.1 hypothetical protein [Bacteroides fragilis]